MADLKLPNHIFMCIEHNNHKICYEKLTDYISRGGIDHRECLSDMEYQRCIETDEIWELQVYPSTPLCFEYTCAPTLNEVLDKMRGLFNG